MLRSETSLFEDNAICRESLMNAVGKSWLKALPFKIFVLAAAYFIVGLLTLAANIPPVIDTVVWLPAGIALTAVLVWGYRVWPGILLGEFGAQAVVHLAIIKGD
jgi:integral membrane sensor domain MASE1